MMPEMDGFQVCQAIKANPETAHIPVVMVTALTDTEDKVRGLEAGADDFLSKPINDTALMARVRSLVRLKMALDEWRVRENTANQLGVVEESIASVMEQSVDGATVLVVEDKDFEVDKIKSTLSDKHNVLAVPAGANAMQLITTHDFDVLIISLNLAEEDGLRLCSHLKSNEKTRAVPIVMIAGEEDMPRVAQGLEMGAHDYLLRPIDANELKARVRTQVRRKRFQERLRASYEVSLSMALTDTLTGLYNRRYFEVHMDKLLQNLQETQKPMGVLMIDIDHFKAVNDTHGHNVGDEILKSFADRLKDKLRSFDLVARLGGEEFVAILPDITPERAYMVAERLRRAMSDEPFICGAEGGSLTVTTSVGGAIVTAGDDPAVLTTVGVLERADKNLYTAKDSGRNCCVFENVGKLDPEIYRAKDRKAIE
jgi:two-component system cell cycle response regulator